MKKNSVSIVRKRKPSDQASKTFISNSNSSAMFLGSGKRGKQNGAIYKKNKLWKYIVITILFNYITY